MAQFSEGLNGTSGITISSFAWNSRAFVIMKHMVSELMFSMMRSPDMDFVAQYILSMADNPGLAHDRNAFPGPAVCRMLARCCALQWCASKASGRGEA
jgi:hypothetical protein